MVKLLSKVYLEVFKNQKTKKSLKISTSYKQVRIIIKGKGLYFTEKLEVPISF